MLFAAADEENKEPHPEGESTSSITLPRSYLIVLTLAAATIALVVGFYSAPSIQSELLPWLRLKLQARPSTQIQTVLASAQPPKTDSSPAPGLETATFDQLRQMAEQGDPAAENSLGLRYATGDGVTLNEQAAVAWFIKAAEQGNVAAQSKLGSIYFSGRGVRQDLTQAYFWMVVARLGGDKASDVLLPMIRTQLTRAQITTIELEADRWLRQRETAKPATGQPKPKPPVVQPESRS